jgi:hypothetical protein
MDTHGATAAAVRKGRLTGLQPMRSHPKDRQPRPTPEQIRALQAEVDAQAKEALGHIYQAVLKTPEFTLQNGTKCRVDPFYEPEVNSGGDLKCGFDVLMEDGGHLEFTVNHTGWGKSFAKTEAQKVNRKGSGRQP